MAPNTPLTGAQVCEPLLYRVATVVQVEEENYRTKTFTTDLVLPGARPGQFAMVWLPGVNEKPLSLMDRAPVRFTVAAVGPFTRAMHDLRPGDHIWVRGPFGNGYVLRGTRAVLVAGGYGVAPMYFLAQEALAQGVEVTVVVGARTRADLLFLTRFRTLGVNLVLTTDDGSYGRRGLVTDALDELLQGEYNRGARVYACGPEPMLEAIQSLCTRLGIPAQLSWDRVMRCAMGLCGKCERNGWLVCRDGPVEIIS